MKADHEKADDGESFTPSTSAFLFSRTRGWILEAGKKAYFANYSSKRRYFDYFTPRKPAVHVNETTGSRQ